VSGLVGFLKPKIGEQMLEWFDAIPNNGFIRYSDIFNTEVITLTEPKLIGYFLGEKAYHFIETPRLRRLLVSLLGNGVLVSEGARLVNAKLTLNIRASKEGYLARFSIPR